jgi:hypothetical protein
VVLFLRIVLYGGGCGLGGRSEMCFGCVLIRSLAGAARLLCALYLVEVTCLAWKLLSG